MWGEGGGISRLLDQGGEKMLDIKPFIADKLENVARVELSYSDNEKSPPLISISETENSSEIVINGEDRVSKITVQLDIYAKTAGELEQLATEVNKRLLTAGLTRSFAETIYSEEVPRKKMRYSCRVDEVEKRILK